MQANNDDAKRMIEIIMRDKCGILIGTSRIGSELVSKIRQRLDIGDGMSRIIPMYSFLISSF